MSSRDVLTKLPRRIGRYDAFLEIGAGGMARLYLGVQRGPFDVKKLVAIKEMRPEIASDPKFFAMFVDEARIAARLNHPNVVHTYEVVDEAPNYYLVMEFLDGQSLLDVLRRVGRANVPLHDHLWILTQLLAGLHYAHSLCDFDGQPLHIVHRDVTPSNVFVCRSGATKLLDFGIAHAAPGSSTATHQGELKGKLGYLAPEQCLGQPAGVQSDLYSVGVMLWEAVAGTRRMTPDSEIAQIQARIDGREPAIERVCPDTPAMLVAILARALATKPEDRFGSAREFQQELERFLAKERSQAGAESVSRLLRAHFEQDRRELYRAVESYIGAWDRESTSTGLPIVSVNRTAALPVEDVTRELRDVGPRDEERQTSQIPVDHLLLRASKSDLVPVGVAWQFRRWVAGARTHLQSLRRSSALRARASLVAVGLGAVVAIAATTAALATRTDEVRESPRPATPQVQTAFAASTRPDAVPDVSPVNASPEPATAGPRRVEPEPVQEATPASSASPRPPKSLSHTPRAAGLASQRTSQAQPNAGPAIVRPRIAPGMDVPAAAARRDAVLDLENPYKQ